MAGSDGSLKKNGRIVLQAGWAILDYHHPYVEVLVVPHSCQNFLFSAILLSAQWYLIVVSMCIFLMTHDAERLFMSLFVIHRSLMKYVGVGGVQSLCPLRKLGFLFIIELWELHSGLKFFILYCEEKEYRCQFKGRRKPEMN